MAYPVLPVRTRRSDGGFVISELIVVVVVVAALIAVVVISVSGLDDDSAKRECQVELRAITAASEQFKAELDFYPPNDKALKDAGLMQPEESPNYRVVSEPGSDEVRYEPVGTRCS